MYHSARWSSGQDGGLSRRKQEFDSPTGHHFPRINLIVGVDYDEGPPVPISNTEVKLSRAEDTCLETDRENRSTPTQNERPPFGVVFFVSCGCLRQLNPIRRGNP